MVTDVVEVASGFVLNAVLPFVIVKRDLSRLPPERLARAWPEASFLAAVFFFGPLSLPVHFLKTRRSVPGFCLGLLFGAGAVLCASLPAVVLSWALGDG